VKLRLALQDGQKATDRANVRTEWLTVALCVLTAAVVVLTVLLLLRTR
jgi:hypothetical protein